MQDSYPNPHEFGLRSSPNFDDVGYIVPVIIDDKEYTLFFCGHLRAWKSCLGLATINSVRNWITVVVSRHKLQTNRFRDPSLLFEGHGWGPLSYVMWQDFSPSSLRHGESFDLKSTMNRRVYRDHLELMHFIDPPVLIISQFVFKFEVLIN